MMHRSTPTPMAAAASSVSAAMYSLPPASRISVMGEKIRNITASDIGHATRRTRER